MARKSFVVVVLHFYYNLKMNYNPENIKNTVLIMVKLGTLEV